MSEVVLGGGTFKLETDATHIEAGLAQTERMVKRSFTRMSKVMAGAAIVGGGAVAAGFAKSFSDAVKQQHAFQETFTLLPNTTQKEFDKVSSQAKQMAARLNVEWKDMSEGLYNAISAGIPQDNILTFMEEASKAAVGGVATLNQAVNVGTTALNAMRAQGYDTKQVFDILFSTVRKGKTTLPELAGSIGYLLPVANAYKVSLEQVSAMISTLTASGIKTRVAMTSIRAGLGELADPAYKAGKALEELTGKSFAQLIESGQDVGKILNMMYEAVGDEQFARLFGLESRAGMLSLIGEGYEKYAEDLQDAINSTGAANAAFEKMSQTLQFMGGVLRKTLGQTFINIASAALPLVTELFDEHLMPAVTKFSNWFADNDELVRSWFRDTWNTAFPVIKDFVTGFIEITKAAGRFAKFIIDNKALLVVALTALGAAITVSFGPAAPAIAGIGLLITLFGDLKEKWDAIVKDNPTGTWMQHGQALVMAVAAGIKSAAAAMWNALLDSLKEIRKLLPFSDALVGPLSDLTASGMAIPRTIAEGIMQNGYALVESMQSTLMSITNVFSFAESNWYVYGMNLVTALSEGVVAGGIALYNAMVSVLNSIKELLPFSDAQVGPLSELTRSGESIIVTLANGIKISGGELSKEAMSALGGLEKILLGEGWMPTESEFSRAVKERISFTSFVERGKGIVRAIKWATPDEFATADAMAGLGPSILERMAPGIGLRDAAEKVKKEKKKKGDDGLKKMGGMTKDEAKKAGTDIATGLAEGVKDGLSRYQDELWTALYPPVDDMKTKTGGFVDWIGDALHGKIDLSGWELPAWIRNDETGKFEWPDFSGLLPDKIVIPTLDLSGWELPAWLRNETTGKFEWPTPGDFTLGKLGWDFEWNVLLPTWLSDKDGNFAWPDFTAGFNLPTLPEIEWKIILPTWLSDDEGDFAWPDPGPFPVEEWKVFGQNMVQALIDGVTSFKVPFADAFWDIFDWVKNLLFPASDAKEGPFSSLVATGTAIIQTIADGVTGATQLLYDAVTGVFANAFSFLAMFAPVEGENFILDNLGQESLEGPLRGIIGIQRGLHNLSKETGNESLFRVADGISAITGAIMIYDATVKGMPTSQPFWSLETLASYVTYRADVEGENNLYDSLVPLAEFWNSLVRDIGYAEQKLEGGTTLESLQSLLELLNKKYDPEGPLQLGHMTGNIAYVEVLENIVSILEIIDGIGGAVGDVITDVFGVFDAEYEWPDWTVKGQEMASSLITGIKESLLGRRDEVNPYGIIIPGEDGALSGLIEVGGNIIQTISDGIKSAQQFIYDAITGVFKWIVDLLFPSSDAKEGPFSNLTSVGESIVQTISDGITGVKSTIVDALTSVFESAVDSAVAVWLLLPNRISRLLLGTREEVGYDAILGDMVAEETPGLLNKIEIGAASFITFWGKVGDKLKQDWDTYLETSWPTHRDLIQTAIWKSLTLVYGENEQPEGVTFATFWSELGDALKTDWNTYLDTGWPTHRDLIEDTVWNSLFSDDVMKPDGVSFLGFWKEVGAQILNDFASFFNTDWPTIADFIGQSFWGAIGGIFGVETTQPQLETTSEIPLALSDSLAPAVQIGAASLINRKADKAFTLGAGSAFGYGHRGPMRLWHAGQMFDMWNTKEGKKRQRSPTGIIPNIKIATIVKGMGLAAIIQSTIALIDIWLPKITGKDLNDYWGEIKTWIKDNIANAWLSDEIKEGLNNLAVFLISAGMQGGVFEKIASDLLEIVGHVDTVSKIAVQSGSVLDILQNLGVKDGSLSILGQASLRGIELTADYVWNESDTIALLGLLSAAIPWARNIIFTKKNILIYSAITLQGYLDRFVIEPNKKKLTADEQMDFDFQEGGPGTVVEQPLIVDIAESINWNALSNNLLGTWFGLNVLKTFTPEFIKKRLDSWWKGAKIGIGTTFRNFGTTIGKWILQRLPQGVQSVLTTGSLWKAIMPLIGKALLPVGAVVGMNWLMQSRTPLENEFIPSEGTPGHARMQRMKKEMEGYTEAMEGIQRDQQQKSLGALISSWFGFDRAGNAGEETKAAFDTWFNDNITNPITEKISEIKSTITDLIPSWEEVGSLIAGAFDNIIQIVLDSLTLERDLTNKYREWFDKLISPMGGFIGGIGLGVSEGVEAKMNELGVGFDPTLQFGDDNSLFGGILVSLNQTLALLKQTVIDWVPDWVLSFIPDGGWLQTMLAELQPITDAFDTITTDIERLFVNLKSSIITIFNNIAFKINSSIINPFNRMVGKVPGMPDDAIPTLKYVYDDRHAIHHAAGGLITKPHLGLVGEKGPELYIPLERLGDILSMAGLMTGMINPVELHDVGGRGGRGGGMQPISITVEGDIYGFDEFEDKVGEAFVELDRDGKLDFRGR